MWCSAALALMRMRKTNTRQAAHMRCDNIRKGRKTLVLAENRWIHMTLQYRRNYKMNCKQNSCSPVRPEKSDISHWNIAKIEYGIACM